MAGCLQALAERPRPFADRRLLRARRERPRHCRAAEKRDELAAAAHSITSSARASSLSGIWRPSVFAVLRLMMRSNFVGCRIGKSFGLSPFIKRPAYTPLLR